MCNIRVGKSSLEFYVGEKLICRKLWLQIDYEKMMVMRKGLTRRKIQNSMVIKHSTLVKLCSSPCVCVKLLKENVESKIMVEKSNVRRKGGDINSL